MQVGLATRLVVSPATPGDWTVLRLNRRKVEREVLEQVVSPFKSPLKTVNKRH